MNRSELTKSVLAYLAGPPCPDQKRQLVNRSLEYVYHTLRHTFKGDDESWQDFIGSSVERVEKSIDLFKYIGKDFEAYLCTCLRFHIQTFKRRDAEMNTAVQMVPSFSTGYEPVAQLDPEFTVQEFPFVVEDRICRSESWDFEHADAMYRRLIIYTLKYSSSVSERFLDLLSQKSKVSLRWLLECRNSILEAIYPVRQLQQKLVEESTSFITRLHQLHRRGGHKSQLCLDLLPDIEEEESLVRKRLASLARRIDHLRLVPHHRTLAKIIGVPKGTIDSSLYYLRRYWRTAEPVLREIIEEL